MKTVDFSKIFRIEKTCIYHTDGQIDLCALQEKDGYNGEEILSNGEFLIRLFDNEQTAISFPISSFGVGESAVAKARAKSGTCALFLKQVGVNVKSLENS